MTFTATAPRVVAAVSRDIQTRIRAILSGWELRFVRSGTELMHALDELRCDMMIVEVHFDASAAAAALRCALSREEGFPVVCVRGVRFGESGHAALDALRMALGAVGAHEFIDLLKYPDDEPGNAGVRAMLERLVPAIPMKRLAERVGFEPTVRY